MRAARFVLPLLMALAAAGCVTHQPSYVIDPATGQPVPVVQQYGQTQYAPSQTYAERQENRGLFTARGSAPTYAPQGYAPQRAYPQQPDIAQGPVQPQPYGRPGYVLQYRPTRPAPAPAASNGGTLDDFAYAPAPAQQPYTLDSGDKLRVVVFGQEGITGSYMVDAGGNVSLPLIGPVRARGVTTQALARTIADRLKQGYVREPHVTAEIEAYRPFFILGEVTTPGQYPYVPNMTVENAIAIAGGFAPRASKREVQVTRNTAEQHFQGNVPLNYPLRPGDTVLVKERWF